MRKIKEKKGTCQACGNVWFWGKEEQEMYDAGVMAEAGKAMMCCGGCLPALLIPNPQKGAKDPRKCPKCNSKAVKVEDVEHIV